MLEDYQLKCFLKDQVARTNHLIFLIKKHYIINICNKCKNKKWTSNPLTKGS